MFPTSAGARSGSGRIFQEISHEVHVPRLDRPSRLTHLPGLHVVRLEEVARLGARGGRRAAVLQARGRGRHQLLRYRGRVLGGRERRDHRTGAQEVRADGGGRAGDQGPRRDEQRPEHARPVAQAHRPGLRGQPEAARRRGDRPLPDPSLRSPHAVGGDAGRARRSGQLGQGALHRRQLGRRVASSRRRSRSRTATAGPIRLDAEPLQLDLPRGGAGDEPALRAGRCRPHPMVASRARPTRRHPHVDHRHQATTRAGSDEFARTALRSPQRLEGGGSRDRRGARGRNASPRRWPWPGCSPSPP